MPVYEARSVRMMFRPKPKVITGPKTLRLFGSATAALRDDIQRTSLVAGLEGRDEAQRITEPRDVAGVNDRCFRQPKSREPSHRLDRRPPDRCDIRAPAGQGHAQDRGTPPDASTQIAAHPATAPPAGERNS